MYSSRASVHAAFCALVRVMRFLAAERIEPCARCGERTPHSHRRLAPLLFAAGAFTALAAWLCTFGAPGVAAGCTFLGLALSLAFADRRLGWHIACERCRGRWLASRRLRWRDLRDTAFT